MDINLLVLNVGNSRLAIGVFVGGELESSARLGHDERANWAGKIADAWSRIQDADSPAIAGVSVNPPISEPLEHLVEQATGQKIQWVGRELDLPVKVLTEDPRQTGADRIVNIAAAYEQMGKACVVVDCGTAITVDCCNDAGEFLGGAIAPGMALQLDALHEHTAKLPRIEFHVPKGAFGTTTQSAIEQGVYHGIRGLVRELAENYATQLGNWPDIIATGGDARKLFAGWELIHAISPDLTLYGIALAYVNHHLKHNT